MEEKDGKWIMSGCGSNDEGCLHNVSDLYDMVEKIGFIPLFKNEVQGFSVEEHTVSGVWWTGAEGDPWAWRETAAREGKVAYGKFFGNRAGFISTKWLPVFANYRRDGYDFDSLWEDGKASLRQKKIMDLFPNDEEIYSNEIKQKAGFGKGGEKNFEGTLSELQMKTYLVVRDFRQRINKKGESYGWAVAVMCTPEHLFGDLVKSCYREKASVSRGKIEKQIHGFFSEATEQDIVKVIGKKQGN